MSGGTDVVDVWLIGDGAPPPDLELLYTVLDPEERLRADAAISQEDRREFIVAHAAMRHIVGRRVGLPPEQIRWTIGPHGKPELRGAGEGPRISLSHSGGLCMVALTRSRDVGVDIQRLIADSAAASLARRFFSPHEVGLVLDAADGEGRAGLFGQLWARKEAVVKAAGSRVIRGLAVPVHGPCPVTVELHGDPRPGPYRVTDVETLQGYRAAVALAGDQDFRVARHRWKWSAAYWAPPTTHPHGAVRQ